MRFSHRATLHHWLTITGRSRHEWIQSAYRVQMIASLVGRIASRSSSSRLPPWVTQNTSGANPSTCSASLASTLSGMSRGKYMFSAPVRLNMASSASRVRSHSA